MSLEIERRFLTNSSEWRQQFVRARKIIQGYLALTDRSTTRVRRREDAAWICVKSNTPGPVRQEFEYPIPMGDAQDLLELIQGHLVTKLRHEVLNAGHLWEIDEFSGENTGLIVAEVELQSAHEKFERPSWLGEEVTDDPRYSNANLSVRPFLSWAAR
jgi:adenylate cyclase